MGGVPHHTWQSWRSVSCWQKSSRAAPTRHQSETGSDTWLATRTAPGAPFCCFCFPVRLLFSGSSFTFWCAFLLFWFHNCSFYSTLSFPRTLQMADFVTSKAIPLPMPTWRKKKVYFSFFSYIIYMCVQYICYNCICRYKLSEIYCSFGIGDEWELGERVIYEYIYRYLRI